MVIQANGIDYHAIEIQLDNTIFSKERIENTPSREDGIDEETEIDLRKIGAELIQKAGIYLDLPQVAIACAQVIFQRFYFTKSLVTCDVCVAAKASIWLASKIEEDVRRPRDVINVFHMLEQQRLGKPCIPMVFDQKGLKVYHEIKKDLIKMEHKILAELGFCVHVQHPHKIIIMYLNMIYKTERNKENLVQTAWNYMNDSFRTTLFCEYQPEVIACACIFLAARMLKIPLPGSDEETEPKQWYELYDAKTEDVEAIAIRILQLYTNPTRSFDELMEKVKQLQEIKKKQLKKLNASAQDLDSPLASGQNSPAADSPNIEQAVTKNSPKRKRTRTRSRSRDSRHRHGHDKKDRRDRDRKKSRDASDRDRERRRDRDRRRSKDRKRRSRSRTRSKSNSRDKERRRERRSDRERK